MTTINPSPALLNDLQTTLATYGYQLQSAVLNPKQNNSRYVFTGNGIKLLIEVSADK